MRLIIKLTIVGLIGFALVRTVPVFWSYVQFRDAVGELAMFSAKRTEQDIAERVLKLAVQFDVPIEREDFTVHRENATVYVDGGYTADLEVFPSKFYPWEFTLHVEETPAAYTRLAP